MTINTKSQQSPRGIAESPSKGGAQVLWISGKFFPEEERIYSNAQNDKWDDKWVKAWLDGVKKTKNPAFSKSTPDRTRLIPAEPTVFVESVPNKWQTTAAHKKAVKAAKKDWKWEQSQLMAGDSRCSSLYKGPRRT